MPTTRAPSPDAWPRVTPKHTPSAAQPSSSHSPSRLLSHPPPLSPSPAAPRPALLRPQSRAAVYLSFSDIGLSFRSRTAYVSTHCMAKALGNHSLALRTLAAHPFFARASATADAREDLSFQHTMIILFLTSVRCSSHSWERDRRQVSAGNSQMLAQGLIEKSRWLGWLYHRRRNWPRWLPRASFDLHRRPPHP